MSKKIKVKLLTCRTREEIAEFLISKKILGVSTVNGGKVGGLYGHTDEMSLTLQDETSGEIFALKIEAGNFNNVLDEKAYTRWANSFIPKNERKYESFTDGFLAMTLTPFTGNINNPDTAFYDVDKYGSYISKGEIIDDDFIKPKHKLDTSTSLSA